MGESESLGGLNFEPWVLGLWDMLKEGLTPE